MPAGVTGRPGNAVSSISDSRGRGGGRDRGLEQFVAQGGNGRHAEEEWTAGGGTGGKAERTPPVAADFPVGGDRQTGKFAATEDTDPSPPVGAERLVGRGGRARLPRPGGPPVRARAPPPAPDPPL